VYIDIDASGCTDTCRHCARDGRPPYGRQFSLDELHVIRNEWGPLVTYCYEPTAHPDFPDIYDPLIAVNHGGWLVTNGYGLAKRADHAILFERMRAMGFHTLSLTLHGLQEHHDWFVCRKGAFEDILQATRRAQKAGFCTLWQIFVDHKGLDDIAALIALTRQETQEDPCHIGIPYHRVSQRLWQYERWRPTMQDICDRQIDQLMPNSDKNSLAHPEKLTAAAWLEKWQSTPGADDFRHPFEPPTWPPQASTEMLSLYIRQDRKVYFDPICAPPICLGKLSEGRENLLHRLENIQAPEHIHIDPQTIQLPLAEQEQLHPSGFSVRYKAISKALHTKESQDVH